VEKDALEAPPVGAPVERVEKSPDLLGRRALEKRRRASASLLGGGGGELEGERSRVRLPVVALIVLEGRGKLELLAGGEKSEEEKSAPHCSKQ